MYMMGMRSDALWCTWVIHFLALWLPLSIILTVVSTGQLFQYSSPGYIFIYFMVFFIRYVFTTLLQPHKSVNIRLHSLMQPLSCQLFSIRSSQHDVVRYFHQHLFLQFPHGRDHRLLGVFHGVFHIHWSAERPGSSLIHLPTIPKSYFINIFYFTYLPHPHPQPSRSATLAAMLHPAAAFTFGTLAFTEWEAANIGVQITTWNVSNTYSVTFQDCLNMMCIDTIWLAVVAWYIANVFPSEYGTQQPAWFLFTPEYWNTVCYGTNNNCCAAEVETNRIRRQERANQQKAAAANMTRQAPPPAMTLSINNPYSPADGGDAITFVQPMSTQAASQDGDESIPLEPVSDVLHRQVEIGQCVDIQDLRKEYTTNTGTKVAVQGLNLTMYSGQITALLGHNGAGKTTVIGMLTGLTPPTSGTAKIQGHDINIDMPIIRKSLGVCPQHDVLYPNLTVEEHLTLFASFKGMRGMRLREEVEKMISSVGLQEKRKAYSRTLSGGQKRKLSVGIAFIGGSNVVILDEPTSGMDPYSRRFTWNVIRNHRAGRVVVLTTHFMDEADLLGDRIAIMGDGKLRCCGSSLYLKKAFGVGYNMTIEKFDATHFDSAGMRYFISSRIPDCKFLTDVGTEMVVQLPFTSSSKFAALFEALDQNDKQLGVRSYGMSVTTLEEVFINVANANPFLQDMGEGPCCGMVGCPPCKDKSCQRDEPPCPPCYGRPGCYGPLCPPPPEVSRLPEGRRQSTLRARDSKEGRLVDLDIEDGKVDKSRKRAASNVVTDFQKLDDEDQCGYFGRHLGAMIHKRMLYFVRDLRSWTFQYILPVIFLLIGMLVSKYTSFVSIQPSVQLTIPGTYNGCVTPFLPCRVIHYIISFSLIFSIFDFAKPQWHWDEFSPHSWMEVLCPSIRISTTTTREWGYSLARSSLRLLL